MVPTECIDKMIAKKMMEPNTGDAFKIENIKYGN